jgi:hypothetical protein
VTAVGNASHGTVVLSNGDASFRPDANFSGIAQFDYTVSNAQGDTSTATVTLDVAPVADEPTLSVRQRLGDGEPGDVIEIGVSPVLDQPVMVTLKNGDSVVAWFETTDGLHIDTLKAQRFDASGNELGGQIVVDQIALSGTVWGFLGKSLVALSDGGFAVTWSDHSADFSQVPAPTATTLNAKIFDPNGHETTGIIPIAARSRPGFTQLLTTAQSAALTNGRFVVEWVMAAQFDDGDTRVKMQVFDNDGGIVGDEILLDNFANITGLTNGRFVAIWNGGSPGAVEGRAQIFDGDGSKIGGEMLVSQGGQVTSVTALSASRFLVAWNDSGGQKAQIFDGDGSKIGGEILVSQEGQVTSVTALSAGRFLVAWNDPGGQEAQIFDDDGSKIGGVLQFSENSVSVRSITALTNGTFVVGWIEATGPLTDTINAQVYDRSGHKVGGQFAISTGVVAGYSTATRPDGGFVVSWSDREFSPASSVHDRVQTFPPPGGPTVAAINTPVPLNVAAALTDTDGSETLTLTVSGIPVGTTLSDGTHTFTVTDGRASVDISNWNFASLRVTPPLDFRGDLQVTFTATSTDTATLSTGPASDTTSVTQIIDILIAPDETLSNDTVAENSPKGTVVGTIIPDLPADVAVTYALTDDAGGRFAIDADTGVVTVGEVVLDYERAPQHQYAITARATNSADGTTFDNTFTIHVTDVNESPTDIDFFPGTATVAENSPNGTPVGRLFGTDLDAGDVLTFSLTDDADKRFAVDAMTGVVTVADGTRLDFETATSYNIGARETDRGGLSRDIGLLIHVTDVNEAPIGEVLTFVRSPVRKFSPDGTPVGTVKGFDPDAGDVLTYALTVNPKGNIPLADPDGIFAIDPRTGIITVADGASLSFSTAKSLGIAVKVTDRGGSPSRRALASLSPTSRRVPITLRPTETQFLGSRHRP